MRVWPRVRQRLASAQSGRRSALHHLIEGNRQVPYPSSCRMVDGIGDGGSDADDAELADRLAAGRRSGGVGDPNRDHLAVRNVGVGRDEIVGQVIVYDSSVA